MVQDLTKNPTRKKIINKVGEKKQGNLALRGKRFKIRKEKMIDKNLNSAWISLALAVLLMFSMMLWIQDLENDITFLKNRKDQHFKILKNQELRLMVLERKK